MSDSTVVASLVASLVQVASQLGVPRAVMLERASLTETMLADPDGRIPFEQLMAVWDVLAEAPSFDRLGVTLGQQAFTTHLGLLGWLMSQSATLREATRVMARYGRLLSDVFTPVMVEDRAAGLAVWTQTIEPRYVQLRQPQEWAMTTCLTVSRSLTGIDWPVREAAVQHPRTGDDLLSQVLGVQVRYGAPSGRLVLDIACLDAPVRASNPVLHGYLEQTARKLLASLPEPAASDTVMARVRRRIAEGLSHAVPTPAAVARQLGLSERTLQRRLADEGTSFVTLLDETRREIALLHLREPTLAVYEVALLLGYSEPSAFYRTFKRWTGTTPQAYRASALATDGSVNDGASSTDDSRS